MNTKNKFQTEDCKYTNYGRNFLKEERQKNLYPSLDQLQTVKSKWKNHQYK